VQFVSGYAYERRERGLPEFDQTPMLALALPEVPETPETPAPTKAVFADLLARVGLLAEASTKPEEGDEGDEQAAYFIKRCRQSAAFAERREGEGEAARAVDALGRAAAFAGMAAAYYSDPEAVTERLAALRP
jgi:hypothetical protein